MNDLIDMMLETVLRSVIWRSTWHMPLTVLIGLGILAFVILAYRRSSGSSRSKYGRSRRPSRRGPRHKSRFWKK